MMKTKAIDTLASAQTLVDNKQFTASVQCSYYAVFQYMKYMLAATSTNPLSLSDQNTQKGDSSHEYILQEIKKRLSISLKDERTFTNEVRFLKKQRVNADYTTKTFTDIESLDCIDKAKGTISKLKTYFGNI